MQHPQEEAELDALDVTRHMLNFVAPAIGLGVLASALAKLIWRAELKRVRWTRLCVAATASAMAALVAGLLLFGRDGRLGTYAAMVAVTAFSLWWSGVRSRPG